MNHIFNVITIKYSIFILTGTYTTNQDSLGPSDSPLALAQGRRVFQRGSDEGIHCGWSCKCGLPISIRIRVLRGRSFYMASYSGGLADDHCLGNRVFLVLFCYTVRFSLFSPQNEGKRGKTCTKYKKQNINQGTWCAALVRRSKFTTGFFGNL